MRQENIKQKRTYGEDTPGGRVVYNDGNLLEKNQKKKKNKKKTKKKNKKKTNKNSKKTNKNHTSGAGPPPDWDNRL
jgi:hypothetical protein